VRIEFDDRVVLVDRRHSAIAVLSVNDAVAGCIHGLHVSFSLVAGWSAVATFVKTGPRIACARLRGLNEERRGITSAIRRADDRQSRRHRRAAPVASLR